MSSSSESDSDASSEASRRPIKLLKYIIKAGKDYLDSIMAPKTPCRTSKLRGNQYTQEILNGSDVRFRELCRMDKLAFKGLIKALEGKIIICRKRSVTVEEQVMIFLYIIGNSGSNRVAGERFQRSGHTISKYFNSVCKAIASLESIYIVQPTGNEPCPKEIRNNPCFYPYFEKCVGAIDGTHIPCIVPPDRQPAHRNRKGDLSQNVLAGCSFNMLFTFVYAGLEGSQADARVLRRALEEGRFEVPDDRFYLADAGYANVPGFLAPYRSVRYHLKEWRHSGLTPQTAKELYNHCHSALRIVIERIFGVSKMWFPILAQMPSYPYKIQIMIVMACCVLHNLIRIESGEDEFYEEYMLKERLETRLGDNLNPDWVEPNTTARTQATEQRDALAERMFYDYIHAPVARRQA